MYICASSMSGNPPVNSVHSLPSTPITGNSPTDLYLLRKSLKNPRTKGETSQHCLNKLPMYQPNPSSVWLFTGARGRIRTRSQGVRGGGVPQSPQTSLPQVCPCDLNFGRVRRKICLSVTDLIMASFLVSCCSYILDPSLILLTEQAVS